MNWRIILSLLVITATVWSGCNKAKELLDVEFDADFTVDLPVTTTRSVEGSFNVEETVDPLSDDDVAKYIDNIKSWNITNLSGLFLQVNPDFDLSNAQVMVSSGDKEAIWNLADQNITEGTSITLSNENGQWETVNEILGMKQEFTVSFSGDSSLDDDFVLQLTIFTRVTANPL